MTTYRSSNYSETRKRIDQIHDKVFPEFSEVLFMDTMNRWWLRFYGFEHQGRLGAYRPDFISRRRKLIIEVDGDGKVPKDIIKQMEYYDAQDRRDNFFMSQGYEVLHLRFSDIRDLPNETRAMVRHWARTVHRSRCR